MFSFGIMYVIIELTNYVNQKKGVVNGINVQK